MQRWGKQFTCIAPDTPGFGQSEPLPGEPEVGDFADAIAEFVVQAGLAGCRAYGFHSGGVILMNALKRHPGLLGGLATGAYAVWSEEEQRIFGERYVPDFKATAYGEHLAWLWHRIQEQSWFFPWFDVRDGARLPINGYTPEQVHAIVMDMLNAGESYRHGYGAVLRAKRDLPSGPDLPPVLISAYDGDPLQDHIDRLGILPEGWQARKLATPEEHWQASLDFLLDCDGLAQAEPQEDAGEGFILADGCYLHWRGEPGADRLVLHVPGAEMVTACTGEVAIDVPGHGLSGDHAKPLNAVRQAAESLNCDTIAWPELPSGEADALYPDLSPDRFGTHLQRAWGVARASALFAPWHEASPAAAIPVDPAAIDPDAIALRARALLRAGTSARQWHEALASREAEAV